MNLFSFLETVYYLYLRRSSVQHLQSLGAQSMSEYICAPGLVNAAHLPRRSEIIIQFLRKSDGLNLKECLQK